MSGATIRDGGIHLDSGTAKFIFSICIFIKHKIGGSIFQMMNIVVNTDV